MLQLQNGVRMREAGSGGVRIVFGAYRQKDSAFAQGEAIFLECGEGFGDGSFLADLDFIEAVVADDAAPEGVIEIEDENLLRSSQHGSDHGGERFSDGKAAIGSGQDLVAEPAVMVEPAVVSQVSGQRIEILDQEFAIALCRFGEFKIEFGRRSGFCLRARRSQDCPGRRRADVRNYSE